MKKGQQGLEILEKGYLSYLTNFTWGVLETHIQHWTTVYLKPGLRIRPSRKIGSRYNLREKKTDFGSDLRKKLDPTLEKNPILILTYFN